MKVSEVFSQDRVEQRFEGQIIETPAISLAEKIVEVPVIQTEEKTQHGVNMCVQHVVDTAEVEKHIIQEKINQETKRIEVPPQQFIDKTVDIPVVAQRQVRMNREVQKTIEIPQLEHTDDVVDVPVVIVAQLPQVRIVMKTVETSQLPLVVQAPRVQIVAETTELLSDVQVPRVRVVAETVEILQSLFSEKIAAISEVLFHGGTKRIGQQPVGSQQQQQDNQPQTARQSPRQERERKGRNGRK